MLSPQHRSLAVLGLLAAALCLAVIFYPNSEGTVRGDFEESPVSDYGDGLAKDAANNVEETEQPQLTTGKREQVNSAEPSNGSAQEWNPKLVKARLRVNNFQGMPVQNAHLLVMRDVRWPYRNTLESILRDFRQDLTQFQWHAIGNVDGVVEVGDLPPHSDLRLIVFAERHTAVEFEFKTNDQLDVDLGEVRLGPSRTVEVELVEEGGRRLSETGLNLKIAELPRGFLEEREGVKHMWAGTDENGVAIIHHFPIVEEGQFIVDGRWISPQAKAEVVKHFHGQVTHIRVTVPDAQWVEGIVKDTDGSPVEGAQITVRRLGPSDWDQSTTEEELREVTPRYLWNSHTRVEYYTSPYRSNADGKFRAPIPPLHSAGDEPPPPLLVSATALVYDDLAKSSKWQPPDLPLELVVPVMHPLSGRVLDHAGNPIPGSYVHFRDRPSLDPDYEKPDRWAYRYSRKSAKCQSDGTFSKHFLAGYYWMQVFVPGGSHRFEGPYSNFTALDIGEIVLPPSRTVTIHATSTDPDREIVGLSADRDFQPMPYEELRETRKDAPWGKFDPSWNGHSARASIKGTTATWGNEPDGKWRYILEAEEFVPVIVDLEHRQGSGDIERTVQMKPHGHAHIELTLADGRPAPNIKVILQLDQDVPIDPIFSELEDSIGFVFREEKRAVTDSEGAVHFPNLIPASYQIVAMEDREKWDFGAPPPSEDRRPLQKFKVTPGRTARVQASLGTLGTVRLWVEGDGKRLANAEVFAVQDPAEEDGFYGQVISPSPMGATGKDGGFEFHALHPGSIYTFGARNGAEDLSFGGGAWSMHRQQVVAGSQDIVISFETGKIRLAVSGFDLPPEIEVSIVAVRKPIKPRENETEEQAQERSNNQFFQDLRALETLRYGNMVATKNAPSGQQVEFSNFPAGRYRAIANFEEEERAGRTISEPFDLAAGDLVDLGILQIVELVPFKVSFHGFGELDEEIADDLNAYIFRVGDKRSTEFESWVSEGDWENWMLPPGDYYLQMYHGRHVVAQSETIQVSPAGAKEFRWDITDWDLPE